MAVGIYKITNIINNKCYIGQSRNIHNRWHDHKTVNSKDKEYEYPLYRAFRKYGLNNFTFEIIEFVDDVSLLNEREIYWIKYYDSYYNGYNLTSGGNNQEPTKIISDETIKAIQHELLTTDIIYSALQLKYNVSIGRISDINQGKCGFNPTLTYPLRPKKKQHFCSNCGCKITGEGKTGLCIRCYGLTLRKQK